MKTILVLASHPELPEALRAIISAGDYRLIHRMDLQDAEPLLNQGLVDLCVLDADLAGVQGVWMIEKLRRQMPTNPLIVYTSTRNGEWEEEAYVHGVTQVLPKPPRARLLNTILERLWATPPAAPPARSSPSRPLPARTSEQGSDRSRKTESGHNAFHALTVLRDFSAVLTHTLAAEPMLKQFLLLLREILGVNRAAIFLRQPSGVFGSEPTPTESRRLRSACAIGLSPGLLEHFELSFEAGIGGYIFHHGRILRRDTDEVQNNQEMLKEFELLGAQVAIPMLDREKLIGVAVFDGRVTGEPLVNGELELVFHLLEELGLAVKNVWLHDQLGSNNQMMADILHQISSGCVVVGQDLSILHANKTARRYFAKGSQKAVGFDFADLPPTIGSNVYQVLRSGAAMPQFRFSPPAAPNTIYEVSIVPFQRGDSSRPASALVVVEDKTQASVVQRLETEAANSRLLRSIAERLAHEVGNALVPISTHQQLLAAKGQDPEFLRSLDTALSEGVRRVSRLTSQMRFLARDGLAASETFPLLPMLQEAFREAVQLHPLKNARLKCEQQGEPFIVTGDRSALRQVFTEIFLNALQAQPAEGVVEVQVVHERAGTGGEWLHVEVKDQGTGFTSESATRGAQPFYTTRTVGVGLGLTVAQKILETHRGKLVLPGAKNGVATAVRVSLPSAPGHGSGTSV